MMKWQHKSFGCLSHARIRASKESLLKLSVAWKWPTPDSAAFTVSDIYFASSLFFISSKNHKLVIKFASCTFWALLLPAALSPEADPFGGLSLRLIPLCSRSIVLPAPGMLTCTVLESAQTHVQTHIYVCVNICEHTQAVTDEASWQLVAVKGHRSIFEYSLSFVSVVCNHVANRHFSSLCMFPCCRDIL